VRGRGYFSCWGEPYFLAVWCALTPVGSKKGAKTKRETSICEQKESGSQILSRESVLVGITDKEVPGRKAESFREYAHFDLVLGSGDGGAPCFGDAHYTPRDILFECIGHLW